MIHTPSGATLHIVNEYAHVGSIVSVTNNLAPEIHKRANNALDAFFQIAARVFGSPHIPISVKSSLAYSLIFTRLLYAAETWTPPSPAMLRVLDAVQSRVTRRILGTWYDAKLGDRRVVEQGSEGASRFALPVVERATSHEDKDAVSRGNTTNEDDRRTLGWPSIECELRRKRLAYAARLCRAAPDTLRALLQYRHEGRPLLWVNTLYDDFAALRAFHAPKLDELPLPSDCMQSWCTFIISFPAAWKAYVRSYIFYTSSALTSRRVPIFEHQLLACPSSAAPSALQPGWFRCQLCISTACRVFPSERALRAHHVAGHGVRCRTRAFIDSDGRCPVCGLNFHTRIRAIAHAQRKSSACSHKIQLCKPLPDDRIRILDADDAASRRAARKSGHATPLATLPGP